MHFQYWFNQKKLTFILLYNYSKIKSILKYYNYNINIFIFTLNILTQTGKYGADSIKIKKKVNVMENRRMPEDTESEFITY